VYQAIDGVPSRVDVRAPPFVLRRQSGDFVSLASLRGRVVVLTFLDPLSTLAAPVIAQELSQASSLLGSESHQVEFVAIDTNPIYRSGAALLAFDRAEGLSDMGNWQYLTGSVRGLEAVWSAYGIEASTSAGSAAAPRYRVFVIDASGLERYQLDANPGPATQPLKASFAEVLASTVQHLLGSG
jgi:cytochrome oxidase Cu insertion factor (SCO1/SenC/PrrC family)